MARWLRHPYGIYLAGFSSGSFEGSLEIVVGFFILRFLGSLKDFFMILEGFLEVFEDPNVF